MQKIFPAGIYLLKINNRNSKTRCEICFKLTIKTTFINKCSLRHYDAMRTKIDM